MSRIETIYPADRVSLREVGLRDGLQLVKKIPSTEAKQRWVREEYAAGVRHFEVGSFLPAKTFPQFVDVRDVIATVANLPGAHGIALALNERGVNEALESGVGEIASVVSATRGRIRGRARMRSVVVRKLGSSSKSARPNSRQKLCQCPSVTTPMKMRPSPAASKMS